MIYDFCDKKCIPSVLLTNIGGKIEKIWKLYESFSNKDLIFSYKYVRAVSAIFNQSSLLWWIHRRANWYVSILVYDSIDMDIFLIRGKYVLILSRICKQKSKTVILCIMDGTGPNSCYTVSPSCSIRGNGKCTQPNNGIEKGFFTLKKRDE